MKLIHAMRGAHSSPKQKGSIEETAHSTTEICTIDHSPSKKSIAA